MSSALVPNMSLPLTVCPECRAHTQSLATPAPGDAISDANPAPSGWWLVPALGGGAAFWGGLLILLL